MAPTEGRVARPERRWGCRRGTRCLQNVSYEYEQLNSATVQTGLKVRTE